MESTELMAKSDLSLLENVLVNGDLSKLTPAQRLDYYRKVCLSLGLNPLTKPFAYISLKGKLTLYAQKDATDQLRRINGVSIDDVHREIDGDYIIVTAKGHDRNGRSDVEIGVVNKNDMSGDFANAMMKANTKAKRRLTLSLCGLGWLDETETETIPNAQPNVVDIDTGQIVVEKPEEKPAEKQRKPWSDEDFLAQFTIPEGVPEISTAAARTYTDANDKPYCEMGIRELYGHWMGLAKRIRNENAAEAEFTALKIGAICRLIQDEKLRRSIKPANGGRPDPFVPEQ